MHGQRLDLDVELVKRGLVSSISQAESYVKLGQVKINGQVAKKVHTVVHPNDKLSVDSEQFVSRAALKLASVTNKLHLDFKDKVVLDVGSSTGGFTQYALKRGARRVIAVDVGTKQMHASLLEHPRLELHEQTDIRNVKRLVNIPDIVVIDVSFISLRQILPHLASLISKQTTVTAMVKPQFETTSKEQTNRGIVKNERIRRDILIDFEKWVQKLFKIVDKADSEVAGSNGNLERFYLLRKL